MIALPVTCPVFIGRRDELEVLNDARRGLAKSRGAFVLVGGEAGIGKSRLVSHFVLRSGDRRVRNLATAECREDVAEPLRPIRTIVETLLSLYVPDTLSAQADRALGRIAPEFASPSGRESARSSVDRTDLFAGLAAVLIAFAEKRATIVVIEDVQWADSSTLDFLRYLAPRVGGTRLLAIATHRSEAIDTNAPLLGALTQIEREATVRRLTLEPFEGRELRELIVASLAGHATIEAESLRSIVTRSQGNAFYAEELLKDALTHGRETDRRLPISIRGTIVQRLQALDDFERRVLSYAAVLGLRFDPLLLAAMIERGVDDILPALRHARDAAIVVEDARDPSWLRFRHALTRQVIYDDLLAFDRRRLHARILETLERAGEPEGSRLYGLAEHAAASGDVSRTLRYGEMAGKAAWELGAYGEAIAAFTSALDVATDVEDRARIMELLAFPVNYGGDGPACVRLWEDARAIRMSQGRYSDATRLTVLLVCERYNLGMSADEGESALAFLEERRAEIKTSLRDGLYITVAALRSELFHVRTVESILDRVEDAEKLDHCTASNIHRARLNAAAYDGRLEAWRQHRADLLALAPYHGNPAVNAVAIAGNLTGIVTSGLYLDAHDDVRTAIAEGSVVADKWGLESYRRYFDAVEAAYELTTGRLGSAKIHLLSALDHAQYLTRWSIARTAPYLALALDDDTLVERASTAAFVEREREAIRADASSQYGRLLLGGYAIWLDRHGRVDEAATYLAEALEGIAFPSPALAPLLTFALRHLGAERVPGLEQFVDAERLAPEDGAGRATASLAAAALARLAGDHAEAVAGFRRAATSYAELGFPLDAAHAFHLAGDADDARASYLRCGAAGYARDTQADVPSSPSPTGWPLSEREQAVAELVTQGFTNVGIAERMSVSPKTVEKYLASIFRKLGLRSRSQIAARLVDRHVAMVR